MWLKGYHQPPAGPRPGLVLSGKQILRAPRLTLAGGGDLEHGHGRAPVDATSRAFSCKWKEGCPSQHTACQVPAAILGSPQNGETEISHRRARARCNPDAPGLLARCAGTPTGPYAPGARFALATEFVESHAHWAERVNPAARKARPSYR